MKGAKRRSRRRSPRESASVRQEREHGPAGWLLPIRESLYSKLGPISSSLLGDAHKVQQEASTKGFASKFRSVYRPGHGEDVLTSAPSTLWLDRLAEYKRRKSSGAASKLGIVPGAPSVPGGRNWRPLGPMVVQNGQAQGDPPVGGRVVGVAIAPGGKLVYAASACGGVFRSDDAGISWTPLMDRFDVDPTNFAATSLACGAIAIDPANPTRVYVGTGEGDTYALFASRIVNALPAYRGIGPIRSDDGGSTWVCESTTPPNQLAGQAFFALAVDPTNAENVVGATSSGVYQRAPVPGGFSWLQRRAGVYSSVVVTTWNGATRFMVAEWGKGVSVSPDGQTWTSHGTGFPAQDVGRIALAVTSAGGGVVYAFAAGTNGTLRGLYRCAVSGGAWTSVSSLPDVLPVDQNGNSQGDYDLAIAVDPSDAGLIYLGGSYSNDPQYWPASIWRCRISASGGGYTATSTSIGGRVHADVHVLVHSPADSNSLWVGCDGGLFLNRAPTSADNFAPRNNGLACLCATFFGQHPADPSVLFCGFQDNGTARTGGGAIWTHVNGGDGGYCLVNWAVPDQVIVFANGSLYRSTNGGASAGDWTKRDFPWATMTEPIVGPPYDPATPSDADLVALGTGQSVFISKNFGSTWPANPSVSLPATGSVYSLVFASASRFYVGTSEGEVFRVDKGASGWSPLRIDNIGANPLGLTGLVSDIGIDWSDASGASIYIAFGGAGDFRHVWHFDGALWEARSGTIPGGSLLDVEHNAMVVDRVAPSHVYVGTDIGVWLSADAGKTWSPLADGLPDAAVFDLQIHPTRRLLRAALHGRGMYELDIT